jgi:S1-C subfamily serine protease
MKNIFTFLFASLLALFLAGCANTKTKTISQRGWIGGEYVLAKYRTTWVTLANSPGVRGTLPPSLRSIQKAAIQVTGMTTNAPAGAAGLCHGDFVLEVNHQPVTSLRAFRRAIDRSEPGTMVAIKAYRDGQFA